MRGLTISLSGTLVLLLAAPSAARWPTDHRVERDILKHWEENWPEQKVEFVKKKTECEKAEWQDKDAKAGTGKSRKHKACLIKADVYVARGYRLFIYRDTYLYYVRRRLRSVQLGELQKAWREGGVPAPSREEALALFTPLAAEQLDTDDVRIEIREMGRPRPYGDVYRLTLLVDVIFTQSGQEKKREGIFVTLQSDGTAWEPVKELAF